MKDVDAWLRAGSRCFGLPGARADGNRVVQGSQELSPIEIEPSTAARSLDEPGSDTCRAPGSSGRTRAHREGAPRSFRGRKSSRLALPELPPRGSNVWGARPPRWLDDDGTLRDLARACCALGGASAMGGATRRRCGSTSASREGDDDEPSQHA